VDAANLFDSRDDKQLRNVFKSETFKMNDRILPNTKVFHVPVIYLERYNHLERACQVASSSSVGGSASADTTRVSNHRQVVPISGTAAHAASWKLLSYQDGKMMPPAAASSLG
jgi:hypothetical protein